ncbi:MAG: MBL fold metallo-hydrolase, partial [Verrucomicrobiales bacterium]
GVRGSIPSPGPETVRYGGNTSCVELRADGELIILDAGSGIRPLGLALAEEYKNAPLAVTLLITHTHWDHIQGFPFFAPAYHPGNSLKILAFECARKHIQAALEDQMESPYFPIPMKQMPAKIMVEELNEMKFQVGAVKVAATFTNHPGICVGYRLQTTAGSIAYLPDNELFQRQKAEQASADTMEAARDFGKQRDEQLIEFLRGVDLLMLDCQYDAEEYPRFAGWGHSCVEDSVRLAMKAEVKRFYMFHHDPTHNDSKIDLMLKRARQIADEAGSVMQVEAAAEEVEIVLGKK